VNSRASQPNDGDGSGHGTTNGEGAGFELEIPSAPVGAETPYRSLSSLLGVPGRRKTKNLTGWTIIAGACGWVIGLSFAQMAPKTMPWCVTMIGSAAATLAWLHGQRDRNQRYFFKLGESRPLVMSEGLAISFVAASLAICTFMLVAMNAPHVVRETRQIVEIEFLANADNSSHGSQQQGNDQAPAQKPISAAPTDSPQPIKSTLGQNDGLTHSQARVTEAPRPPLSNQKAAPVRKPVAAPNASAKQRPSSATVKSANQPLMFVAISGQDQNNAQPARSTAPSHTILFNPSDAPAPTGSVAAPSPRSMVRSLPSTWHTTTIASTHNTFARGNGYTREKQQNTGSLEEVKPPEMVELTDSAAESREQGSTEAAAHTVLTSYLKELHTRIKHAWAPPPGDTHKAEILFRIKRNGQLSSIKIVKSSGNEESDESAMTAIAGCAPFKPLPTGFASDYLDLLYTFNYTVDRLSEAPVSSVE
jgi:protein TonB